jgi:hypothetical protein
MLSEKVTREEFGKRAANLIGRILQRVTYWEIPYEHGKPNWRDDEPQIDVLDFGLDLHFEDGGQVGLTWGDEFFQYGLSILDGGSAGNVASRCWVVAEHWCYFGGLPISPAALSGSWVESDSLKTQRIDYPEALCMAFGDRGPVYACALDYSGGTILPLADSVLVVFGDVAAQRLGLGSEEPNSDSLKLENRSFGHYPSGAWWACLNGNRQPFEDDLRSALPLLELPWPEIKSKLSLFPEKARKGFPVQLLISYALDWPTEYWRVPNVNYLYPPTTTTFPHFD